jgi:sarcosine oxidase subunit beta
MSGHLAASTRSVTDAADAVVVGGGAMGASIAYHLAAAGAGRVILLEREAALGTARPGCRRLPDPVLERDQRPAVARERADDPAVLGGADLPLDVDVDGYVFLVRDEAAWAEYRAAAAMQRSLGARVEELDASAAEALVPGLNVDGIVGATFGPDDG